MGTYQRHISEEYVEQTDDATIHHFSTSDRNAWPTHTLVIEAFERVTNQPVSEMEPLSDHVDPDALDRVFQTRLNGQPRGDGEVVFPWAGHQVTVTHDGITIKDIA